MKVSITYHWPGKAFGQPQPVFDVKERDGHLALYTENGFFAWYDTVKDSLICHD